MGRGATRDRHDRGSHRSARATASVRPLASQSLERKRRFLSPCPAFAAGLSVHELVEHAHLDAEGRERSAHDDRLGRDDHGDETGSARSDRGPTLLARAGGVHLFVGELRNGERVVLVRHVNVPRVGGERHRRHDESRSRKLRASDREWVPGDHDGACTRACAAVRRPTRAKRGRRATRCTFALETRRAVGPRDRGSLSPTRSRPCRRHRSSAVRRPSPDRSPRAVRRDARPRASRVGRW